jgi:cytochrome P450
MPPLHSSSPPIANDISADQIAGNVSIFILAMILHPESQARGQAEIDRVVGKDRLPNFDDRKQMPYIEAILREIMRWRPSGPLSACALSHWSR